MSRFTVFGWLFSVQGRLPTVRRERPWRCASATRYVPRLEVLEGRCLPTVLVSSTADSGFGSLREAIRVAGDGDTIVFSPNLSGQTITLTNSLSIFQSITIMGLGANNLTISGGGTSSLFDISDQTVLGLIPDVVLSSLTLANAHNGAIFNFGMLEVSNCTLSGNTRDFGGGGIVNYGILRVGNSTLSSNSARSGGFGGAIFNGGSLSLAYCTLSNNTATAGGGIFNDGSLTVSYSTLSGNIALQGGGIYDDMTGSLTVTNSTLFGNIANFPSVVGGGGGGIFNDGSLTVSYSTLSGNFTLSRGGGILSSAGRVEARDTIIAGNTAASGPDLFGGLSSDGHNLIGNTVDGSGFVSSDLLNFNPLLGSLQANGGPTATMALLPGSPALAAGDGIAAPATDQRGLPRMRSGTIDIGAFESLGFGLTVVSGYNQQTTVNTAFGTPLVVLVTSVFGEPVQGGVVTFTSPGSGASATLASNTAIINAMGQASVTATANAIAGTYIVIASAKGASAASFSMSNSPAVPMQQSVSAAVQANSTVMTSNVPTTDSPVQTSVTTPNPGTVSIQQAPSGQTSLAGYQALGEQVVISAPAATPGTPLQIVFSILVPSGTPWQSIIVFKDGVAVPQNLGSAIASPDPCVSNDSYNPTTGVLSITILTSTASTWNFGLPPAILVLDPTANGALTVSGNALFNVTGNLVVDSTSSSALTASGNAVVKATRIQVAGNVLKSANATISPVPSTGATALPDPLAIRSGPSTAGLTNYGAATISGGVVTLLPGIYSQITISGNASVTFSAGVYILEGGGLTVSGGASVTGTGILIYNTGNNYPIPGGSYGAITLSGSGTVKLSGAPTGVYAGILIDQDPKNGQVVTISGSNSEETGIIYAPKAQLVLSGSTQLHGGIDVDLLTISGSAVINSASPPGGGAASTRPPIPTAFTFSRFNAGPVFGAGLPTPPAGKTDGATGIASVASPVSFPSRLEAGEMGDAGLLPAPGKAHVAAIEALFHSDNFDHSNWGLLRTVDDPF